MRGVWQRLLVKCLVVPCMTIGPGKVQKQIERGVWHISCELRPIAECRLILKMDCMLHLEVHYSCHHTKRMT